MDNVLQLYIPKEAIIYKECEWVSVVVLPNGCKRLDCLASEENQEKCTRQCVYYSNAKDLDIITA